MKCQARIILDIQDSCFEMSVEEARALCNELNRALGEQPRPVYHTPNYSPAPWRERIYGPGTPMFGNPVTKGTFLRDGTPVGAAAGATCKVESLDKKPPFTVKTER